MYWSDQAPVNGVAPDGAKTFLYGQTIEDPSEISQLYAVWEPRTYYIICKNLTAGMTEENAVKFWNKYSDDLKVIGIENNPSNLQKYLPGTEILDDYIEDDVGFKGWYPIDSLGEPNTTSDPYRKQEQGNTVWVANMASGADLCIAAVFKRFTTVDLSKIDSDITVEDGCRITGELTEDYKISIEPNATVTLKDVDITSFSDEYEQAGITVLGDAMINLEGTNTIKGNGNYPGIYLVADGTLVIDGTGSLSVSASESGNGSGIGACTSSGNIIIKGGEITASGGESYGAGIGCGYKGKCGDITITGGTVTATGARFGAGIGSGASGKYGNITITGGTVTATGGEWGAGIGQGDLGTCGKIIINGGTVTATGGAHAAGIGSGYKGSCDDITITGGIVIATGGKESVGIGGDTGCGNITITNTVTKVTATKGTKATNSIGVNKGTANISIGDTTTTAITESPYTYQP